MEKVIRIFIFVCCSALYGQEVGIQAQQLQEACLKCHIQEQIPDELIYKRYLMKYSTTKSMEKAIENYLKNPKKENSIMPPPFFLKFPMKEALVLDDENLEKNIRAFLDMFDVKKKLVLPQ
ncbi:hypothetical protein [Sulfurovum sp.]|uniref:hypothetical protein n=1 Tax=Sulfurovum sp. TaxID=1969726 RepID=UPI002867CBC0|nr:hypothetical protein [Sulfurovum sp.]